MAELLQAEIARAGLGSQDRRLAREMVSGIVRRQATLDALVTPHIRRARENVEDPLWRLLQMGVYELAFLAGIPPRASVNETTELARFLNRPRWTGFLNGTLRSISQSLLEETTDSPAADAFPVEAGRYRKSRVPCFPDPQTDPEGYFAAAFSFPSWLVERWEARHSFEELVEWGFWFNAPPPLVLRVNPLKTTRAEILERFREQNIPADAGPLPNAIRLPESRNVAELAGFAEGWFSVQDLTAMKAVELLNPRPGETVWDVCAAPGTKTGAIAEHMQNQGRVVATDIHARRLARIEDNKQRLGLDIIDVEAISPDGEILPAGPFDAALVDVPCSNTGVLGKRVEARWRLRPADLAELPGIQRRLLDAGADRIRPGGRLVYSTCSIEPEENENVVESFLKERTAWQLVEQHTHWPGKPADGGFAALLQHAGGSVL